VAPPHALAVPGEYKPLATGASISGIIFTPVIVCCPADNKTSAFAPASGKVYVLESVSLA